MRVMSLTSQPSQPFSAFWTLLIPLPLIYVTLLKIVFKKCVSTWALKTRKIRLFGTSLNKAICHFLRIFYCREQIQVANKPVFPSPYATPSTPPNTPQCRWMWRNACSKNDWILMSKMKSFLSFYPSSIPCISKFNVDFLCVQFQSLQYYLA